MSFGAYYSTHPLGGAHCPDVTDNAPNEVFYLNSNLLNIKEKICFFRMKDGTDVLNGNYMTVIAAVPTMT